ncbi:IS701 family transposase [Nocardia sp. 2YAB30]|uniref:IS701 family transposase n=1 Tax=Nocardia sp. 2YAB30 TaxID=3233022 RepID=UPI003F9D84B5
MARVAGCFGRVEPRRAARKMLTGLVSELPVKNCWTIAEHVGDATPDALQHLLSRAVWNHDEMRDRVRDYVLDHLGDLDAILVCDETGDVKKGTATAGVQRQYTGTAGRIENSQIAVYLTYATRVGHAFIDRALYLPASWTGDRDRCREAGVPDEVEFATKPALATTMIARALDAGVTAPWVAGDEVYGADPKLRGELETRGVGYVLAIACDRRVTTAAGRVRADAMVAALPKRAWQALSSGDGAKGPRVYDWAWLGIEPDTADPAPGHRWLLARRNRTSGELAYCRCYATSPVTLNTLVKVAGRRWSIEENFQTAKGLTGLDQHQVRRWTSWHRWTVLVMLAHAFLTVLAIATRTTDPTPTGQIPMTRNEIRHLFAALLIQPIHDAWHRLRWSTWRRRHQHRAKTSHYQRRQPKPPEPSRSLCRPEAAA